MVTGSGYSLGLLVIATVSLGFACEDQPPQDPSQSQVTYQNGYAQTTNVSPGQAAPEATAAAGPVTYTPTDQATGASPIATAAPLATTATAAPTSMGTVPMQTTPVPVGVQALPPPSATVAAGAVTTPGKTLAVPGPGAFACTSDAQCMLGRCNTLYGKCAYPCKDTAIDCKTGNVCTPAGVCMPRIGGGVGM